MTEWAVIVPFSKPSMLYRMLENIGRQATAGHDLTAIIVCNGPAFDTSPVISESKQYPFETIALQSAAHQSHAKNTGIRWVSGHRIADKISLLDCDDYYSSHYLSEQARYMKRKRLVGKRMGYVFDDVGLFEVNSEWQGGLHNDVHGAAMCFHTEDAIHFPILPVGEDTLFAYTWSFREGFDIYATSGKNYCYIRGVANTWRANVRLKVSVQGFKVISHGPVLDTTIIDKE
jgi:hypothetical protein